MAESVAGQGMDFINQTGIFNVIFPFILGFAVTYGMLEKTQVFGKNMQRVNAVIAFAVGLIAALTFYK
ncbi:MAG: hypothetical protein JW791_00075 [Nanoarchaeota archaeon]|nr:hypothetical protein [Nanoarchaeota archaeon]